MPPQLKNLVIADLTARHEVTFAVPMEFGIVLGEILCCRDLVSTPLRVPKDFDVSGGLSLDDSLGGSAF